jgi:hypothetical protein
MSFIFDAWDSDIGAIYVGCFFFLNGSFFFFVFRLYSAASVDNRQGGLR